MLANGNLISCNFSNLLPHKTSWALKISSISRNPRTSIFLMTVKPTCGIHKNSKIAAFNHNEKRNKKGLLQICPSTEGPQGPLFSSSSLEENELPTAGGSGDDGSGGAEDGDWTTSFLLFVFWAGLMYYVFILAPNQTPLTDTYFLKKLLNLKGDDGFKMNEVLVALWYIMGLWPLLYSMLLLPTGRSSKSKIPLWPFLTLSFFGGAYALIPYFVLWRPPPPPVEEKELQRWPLNFLESKLTAGVTLGAGVGLMIYAGLSSGDVWKEFYQYFRESKFIHLTSIDFTLLSAFAPFWVYNDMTVRKCNEKLSWLVLLSMIPFLGPSLYLVLRPALPTAGVSVAPSGTTLDVDDDEEECSN